MSRETAAGWGTRLVEAGRRPEWTGGIVNPPVWRASTCLFPSVSALDAAIADPDAGLYYGRRGTPTIWALESALTGLEAGAGGTKLYPSGAAAVTAALLAFLESGDHLLMVDSAYEPTRALCRHVLAPMGVETSFYDPLIGAGIAGLIRPNTRVLFMESPGSLTFEVQDVPALAAAAHARGLVTMLDNTWATPLRFQAIAHGVDVSIQALTKYVGGHADLLLGAVTATPQHWERLRRHTYLMGLNASPDDAWLALRGLRTLSLRLDRHAASALAVARWLAGHPLVDRVLHPALPSCPGHEHFARDFTGGTGLFAVTLKRGTRAHLGALLDPLEHFGIGFSWGGYESLALPVEPRAVRSATRWQAPGPTVRLHVGLDDPADLIADLAAGLDRYEAALG